MIRWLRRHPSLGLWLLVVIWAANFSIVKAALADFRPLAFNALRFGLASAAFAPFLLVRRQRPAFDARDLRALLALGLLGNTLYQVLFILGIDWTLAGNASLMLATAPVFVLFLSVRLGHEEPSPAAWVGVALSFLGVGLVAWAGRHSVRFGAGTWRGDLTLLAASAIWSAYTVGSRDLIQRRGALPVTAVTLWIGALGLAAVAVPDLLAQRWSAVRPAAWGGLLFSGILSIALAYLLWYVSVEQVGSSRTAIVSNAIPVVALLFAWLTLGERPTWLHAAGAAAILTGVFLLIKGRQAAAAGPTPPVAAAGRTRASEGAPRI